MSSSSPHAISANALQSQSLKGTIRVPGDKSISHRALMLGSQVLGETRVCGLLEGEDVLATAGALRHLGVKIDRLPEGDYLIQGVGVGGLSEPSAILDMGNAGTGARLMMGLLASYPFPVFFTGDQSLCRRPMQRVIAPLEQSGATFLSRSRARLPLAMQGAEYPLAIEYALPVASAQVKSAVLLAGLNTLGTTIVIEPEPTRDHTERMLHALGFELTTQKTADGATRIALPGLQEPGYRARRIDVPGDPSSAAFVVVAALIVPGSDVTIEGVCVNPLRTGLFTTLREMGADIAFVNEREQAGEPVADLRVRHSGLRGIRVPAERAPSMIDEYPILAVAAAFAEGETQMHGLAELRVKESDRLSAIVEGLQANGIEASAEDDTLRVIGSGQPRGGGVVLTHFDHRIAMSFLVLGLAASQKVEIDDGRAIATSFPGFAALMQSLGAAIESGRPAQILGDDHGIYHNAAHIGRFPPKAGALRRVIAIDGPAASGKGTLARRLADHFGYAYLDTGSLYRAVGMKLLYAHLDPSDPEAALEAAMSIDDEDLANPRLRQERVGQAASIVSAMPAVRAALLDFQRQYAKRPEGAVLDGRDIGTVVCPEAEVKIFITAELEARARRRHRELSGEGIEVVYASVLDDLAERDERDSRRQTAPMKAAADALVLDSTEQSAQEVFELVLRHIKAAT